MFQACQEAEILAHNRARFSIDESTVRFPKFPMGKTPIPKEWGFFKKIAKNQPDLARASILAPFLLLGWGMFPENPDPVGQKMCPPRGKR
jgi:hypothetical protein